jgi:hypothetical protein
MDTWTVPIPLSAAVLWPICLLCEIGSRLSGRATILNLQKHAELRAAAWVCDPSLIRSELGIQCPTILAQGIGRTLEWYSQQRWL